MNWFKQTLANVVGTEEPEYGPTAIQSVAEQTKTTPYTELTSNDLRWKVLDSTCVATQTFYFLSDEGVNTMAQVIYSNVGGIRTTCQFSTKIFDHSGPRQHQFCSDPLDNYGFSEEQTSFYADNLAVTLNDSGDSYSIKSAVNDDCIVNLTVRRKAPGFVVGKDGTSYFGVDHANPWGSMRHAFWARCSVEGTMQTKSNTYNLQGRALFIHALQGMKPHHAAAMWKFVNFQTPTYSAVMMEFTTPPSYGKTVVNVGGIVQDDVIVCAGTSNTAKHLAVSQDSDNDWPEPKAIMFNWSGKMRDGQNVTAEIMGDLPPRADRVDVLAHIPGFVKTIVGGVVGTKPYIYQYCSNDTLTLKVKIGESEKSETGKLLSEAVFIS